MEQKAFSADDENVQRPVPLPKAVARILARDRQVQALLREEKRSPEELPEAWFLVSDVHLKDRVERDLLVVGNGPLLGANVTTFWVFRETPGGFEPALTVAAHDLILKDSRTAGYRDIETLVASAVQAGRSVYRFDGRIYRLSGGKSARIR